MRIRSVLLRVAVATSTITALTLGAGVTAAHAAPPGISITDAPNGKFTIWITNEQLEKLQVGGYEHSLIRIQETGLRLRIWSGNLTVNAGPTR